MNKLGSVLERIRPLVTDFSYRLTPHSDPGAAHYSGHLAIAGGYLRDIALGKRPKDLDVFFDADHLSDLVHAAQIGRRFCGLLEDGARVTNTFASYGTWALDVECVVRIELPYPTHYCSAVIPENIDLVFLRPSQLKKHGYDGQEASYLRALCDRVDLRLNALGVSPNCTYYSEAWLEDKENKRLVVQAARLQPDSGDDMKRITKRLERLVSEKFKGYSIAYEMHDGSLSEFLPQAYTVIRAPGK